MRDVAKYQLVVCRQWTPETLEDDEQVMFDSRRVRTVGIKERPQRLGPVHGPRKVHDADRGVTLSHPIAPSSEPDTPRKPSSPPRSTARSLPARSPSKRTSFTNSLKDALTS
jgi:hypothetical protein